MIMIFARDLLGPVSVRELQKFLNRPTWEELVERRQDITCTLR